MSDPFGALQPAVIAALKASAAVTAKVGQRAYDRVPKDPVFPYLRVDITDANEDDIGDAGQCLTRRWSCNVEVHIWSRAVGRREASEITGPVRAALDAITTVAGFKIEFIQFRQARMLDDPDGITTHGVVTTEFMLSE